VCEERRKGPGVRRSEAAAAEAQRRLPSMQRGECAAATAPGGREEEDRAAHTRERTHTCEQGHKDAQGHGAVAHSRVRGGGACAAATVRGSETCARWRSVIVAPIAGAHTTTRRAMQKQRGSTMRRDLIRMRAHAVARRRERGRGRWRPRNRDRKTVGPFFFLCFLLLSHDQRPARDA
jgi:hypothetical protein